MQFRTWKQRAIQEQQILAAVKVKDVMPKQRTSVHCGSLNTWFAKKLPA